MADNGGQRRSSRKKPRPSSNGGNGRDDKGRFAPGNPGGTGNPYNKMTHALRQALCEAANEDHDGQRTKAEALAQQLWEMALGEDTHEKDVTQAARRWAMQEIIHRSLGKPKESVELTGTFTVQEFYRAIGNHLRAG